MSGHETPPENVECPECHGVKRVCLNGHPHTDCPWTVDCPVCTPESVDSPTEVDQ